MPIGSSKSNTIFSWWPRAAMPITSLTWTSRQARTQRLHWMQASSCTAIAGWLRSGAGASCARKAAVADLEPVGPLPEARIRVVRGGALRLVADQQLEHHLARKAGALARGLHLHARRRLAHARGGQHPLALDLDHAGAAIAVGAIAGLGQPAQMRDLGALPVGHLPDRLARLRPRPRRRREKSGSDRSSAVLQIFREPPRRRSGPIYPLLDRPNDGSRPAPGWSILDSIVRT